MRLFTPDGQELMHVTALRRDGNNLVIDGTIMGAMPTQAVIRPDEARAIFRLIKPGMLPFLASFMLRRKRPVQAAPINPLAGLLDDY
jgi:hypothetical protein